MTGRGKFLLTLLVLGLLAFGVWRWYPQLIWQPGAPGATPQNGAASANGTPPGNGVAPGASAPATARAPMESPEVTEPDAEVSQLPPPAAYVPMGNVVEIELSEYAGYAGLIAANGGLDANPNSVFARKHGFQVKLTLSEEESWPALNTGKMAASATTVDVLAVYGKQFEVVVPAQIGYSRGADAVVVRSDIKSVNALRGRTLATVQFTEAEFFVRYLAGEAGLPVHVLHDLAAKPDPGSLNLVFCSDSPAAAELFVRHAKADHPALAGFVGWAPSTNDAIERSGGRAHALTSNTNLLIVADILVVNKGFAQQKPDMVRGLVDGLLEGNRLVRENPEAQLDVLAKAFKWDREKVRNQLRQVHLANLPESRAFFSGAITSAGSFGGIYQSAVWAYGAALVRNPVDADRFLDSTALDVIENAGTYKDQAVAIAPIRAKGEMTVERDPLLSKNIRFLFAPMSADLDMKNADNLKNLDDVKRLLQVSPGSTLTLRGHVDNANLEEIRRQGGEPLVRKAALQAVELSKRRAAEIKRVLVDKYAAEATRLEVVGRGWEEPVGSDSDQNRRVEVQWFTLE
ncbi:MAG: OmpA family protein [Planctomycetes bacterium]|nr:OmpA family protein [Planctomycetota bacterium]